MQICFKQLWMLPFQDNFDTLLNVDGTVFNILVLISCFGKCNQGIPKIITLYGYLGNSIVYKYTMMDYTNDIADKLKDIISYYI